jgi:hypothetical protein
MDCADVRDDRLDALYGEASEQALRRVAAHHAACAACRAEFDSLRVVRRRLGEWKLRPHEPRAVQGRVHPLAGLAAAALLLLALGAALRLSGAAIEYQAGPVRISAGRPEAPAPWREQQARYSEQLREMQAAVAVVEAQTAAAPDQEAILQRVQQQLRESEERQALRLNAGIEGLVARTDVQRRYDLARISAGLSYLDGKNGEHVARASELMGYVLQASQNK